jgi:hypothetical protein
MAYNVPVTATEPGARIEVNGEYIGDAPLQLKIFGDTDGTFHDFGSYTYVVRALPQGTNQYPQAAVFATGRMFTHEDRIPKELNFDMNRQQPVAPPYAYPGAPPPYYYPYPYYYPPPYYYGYYYYGGPYYYHGGGGIHVHQGSHNHH